MTQINISAISIRLAAMGFHIELNQEYIPKSGINHRRETEIHVFAPAGREGEHAVSELIFRARPRKKGRSIDCLAEMRVDFDHLTTMEPKFKSWMEDIAAPLLAKKRAEIRAAEEQSIREDAAYEKYQEAVRKHFGRGFNVYSNIVRRKAVNGDEMPVGIQLAYQIPGQPDAAFKRHMHIVSLIKSWNEQDQGTVKATTEPPF